MFGRCYGQPRRDSVGRRVVMRKVKDINTRMRYPVAPGTKRTLRSPNDKVFPTASDIADLVKRVLATNRLAGSTLLRAYYYDGPPMGGTQANPLGGDFKFETSYKSMCQRLHDSLAQSQDFAVRKGETVFRGWKLKGDVLTEIAASPRVLTPNDLSPIVEQKGVDLRIGLDVALLSVKRIVDTIVLVTGDSDLVPAMKFARREGLWVCLDTMGHGVRPNLTEHADFVFNSSEFISFPKFVATSAAPSSSAIPNP